MDTTSFTITPQKQISIVSDNKSSDFHEVKNIESIKHEILDKLSQKGSGGFWIWYEIILLRII